MACAGRSRSSGLAARAAASEAAIRDARSAVDSVLQRGRTDRLESLLVGENELQAEIMGTAASRAEIVANVQGLQVGNRRATLLAVPAKAEYCLDGGFETGEFNFRPANSAETTPSRAGTYAIAWTTTDGTARIRTIVIDSARDARRIVGRVECQTWQSLQLRSRRAIVEITPLYFRQGVPKSLYADLTTGGWRNGFVDGECSSLDGEHIDYANRASAIDGASVLHSDVFTTLIGARLRVGERMEVEIAGTPKALTACSTAYNPSGETAITAFHDARFFAAYLTRRFKDLRFGAGPTLLQSSNRLRHVRVNAARNSPTRGVMTAELGHDSTTRIAPGLGGLAGYTTSLGSNFVADLNARVSFGGSVAMPALPSYSAKAAGTMNYAFGVSLGWAF